MKTNRLASTFALTLLFAGIGMVAREARAQGGPYQYFAITPCRLYDSRTGQPSALGTGGGKITTTLNDATGLRPLRARGGCGVPNTAQAVTVNHTRNFTDRSGRWDLAGCARIPLEGDRRSVARSWPRSARRSRMAGSCLSASSPTPEPTTISSSRELGPLPKGPGASTPTTGPSTSPGISSHRRHRVFPVSVPRPIYWTEAGWGPMRVCTRVQIR